MLGITSGMLLLLAEMRKITTGIAGAVYDELNASFGHDCFSLETMKIPAALEGLYAA